MDGEQEKPAWPDEHSGPVILCMPRADFVQAVRKLDLEKPPGIAETLDCVQAVASLGNHHLNADVIEETMGCVAKSMEDQARLRAAGIGQLLSETV